MSNFRVSTVENVDPGDSAAIYDLLLMMTEGHGTHNEPTGMTVRLTYATDLFDEESVRRFAEQFVRVLDAAATDAESTVAGIELLDAAERQRLLEQWNDTGGPPRRGRTLVDAFDEQVARTPDARGDPSCRTARSSTYREFDARVNRLARWLISRGAGPETVVAVAIRRSVELVTALYAVVKSGAAFLPIDPDHPSARTADVLRAARPLMVLTTSADGDGLPDGIRDRAADRSSERGRSVRCTDHGRAAARAAAAGQCRLRPVHLRLDRRAQGGGPDPRRDHEPVGVGAAAVAARARPTQCCTRPRSRSTSRCGSCSGRLQTGAQIVVAEPDGHRDPAYLGRRHRRSIGSPRCISCRRCSTFCSRSAGRRAAAVDPAGIRRR